MLRPRSKWFVKMRWNLNNLAVVGVSVILCLVPRALSTPFIVQSLSSRYAIVLGGYGPGYSELKRVEVVKHDKVCQNAIR